MKKAAILLFTVFSILISLFPLSHSSHAASSTGYGRVLTDGVIFYRDNTLSTDSALFTLTKSYYVFIHDINTTENYYTVEYQQSGGGYLSIIGFVKKTDLKVWDAPSQPYYPEITATVLNGTALYRRPSLASEPILFISKGSQTLKLYGSIFNAAENALYYYVIYYGFTEGYIPAAMLDVTAAPLHSDPMPTPTPTPTPLPSQTAPTQSTPPVISIPGESDSILQIILIAAICIPALIIVYLMFKPSKKANRSYRQYHYDDDDTEEEEDV